MPHPSDPARLSRPAPAKQGGAGSLFYQGSGIGADKGFDCHVLSLSGEGGSGRRPHHAGLSFLRWVGDHRMIAVRHFGKDVQEIVLVDTRGDALVVLGSFDAGALMYPMLSPRGDRVAVLVVEGRRDAPPRSAAVARLCVLEVPPGASRGGPLTGVRALAGGLPAIPFDWAATNAGLYFTEVDPPRIVHAHADTGVTTPIADGLFPRASPDGEHLAFSSRHDIVVKALAGAASPPRVHALEGHAGWMAWSPDGKTLAYTEELPAWRVRLGLIELGAREPRPIHETARAKNLSWIEGPLDWPAA